MVLRWRRARFHVMRRPEMGDELQPREVSGIVAGPFGIHKDGSCCLVHVPTGCKLISLPKMGRCKSLAR